MVPRLLPGRVYASDLRAVPPSGYCSRGGRKFCMEHGLSWDKLLREGLSFAELRAVGEDAMVERLIAFAEERRKQEAGCQQKPAET